MTPASAAGDDAGLARPGEEDDLLPRPAPAAIRHRGRARTVSGRASSRRRADDDASAGPRLSQMSLHGRFAPERDEDEDHDDLRDRVHERAHVALVARVHPEPQAIHVADDQPGEERAQVATAAGRVDREVADRDDGDDRDRRRLAPDARAPIRDDEREQDAEADPERGRDPELLRGSRRRASAPTRRPPMTTPASTSASTAPVASLSADSAIAVCSIFWRSPIRSKSGMRIAGSVGASTAPMRSPVDHGTSKASAAIEPATSAVRTTPGIASSPRPIATRLRTRVESWRPAVEEDERHAERQEELDAGGVERNVDRIGDRRPEQHARREEDEHAGNPQRVRHQVADEAGAEHERRA